MNNYLDLTKYSDSEVKAMLKEKQKEYMILIQSEKVAKMILDYYSEEFFTSAYHTRVNNEYYLIYERAAKKNLLPEDPNYQGELGIPTRAVIARLEDSRDELRINNDARYLPYSNHLVDIVDNITYSFYNTTICYKGGYLYLVDENNEERLLDKNSLAELLEHQKKKTL